MGLSRSSRQYMGVRALLPPDLQQALRDPTTSDTAFVKGTLWLNTATPASFMYSGAGGIWIALGSGTTGGVVTINSLSPVAGNIIIAGTANQIAIANAGHTVTLSVPAAFIAPGSIASTTTITSGSSLVSTTTITSGTGITATTGNIVASAGNISATLGSMAAGTSVTAGTTVTATLGNITATNGNFVKGSAANKDVYTSLATTTTAGANAAGTVTLVAGTATISTTSVTGSSKIRTYRQSVGATGAAALGLLSIGTITASTSFIINSVLTADATSLATTDVSVVFWEIVN